MRWEPIHKSACQRADANLADYPRVRQEFSWELARGWLSGLPGGAGLNEVTDLTYRELAARTNRFANLLDSLGVGRGERVFSLLGRIPELYLTALGTLKHASVYSPLFAAFGPEPVRERLALGDGVVLVTTPELYRTRVAGIRDSLPQLRHVLVTGDGPPPAGTMSLTVRM